MQANITKNTKEKIIKEILKSDIKTRYGLMMVKKKMAKKYKISVITNSEILAVYNNLVREKKMKPSDALEMILRKRAIRTLSGIAPVSVLTMPYPCSAKCAYCPTEKNMPKSYLSNEPAVMRAIRCNFDPYVQVQYRLKALIANGHRPEKIELIVIGGTWSALPMSYKYWYILQCFKAANDFKISNFQFPISKQIPNSKFQITKKSVEKIKQKLIIEQEKNEKARYRIIGITFETRPDYIDKKELLEMRELGCTRVEMGVQAVDDNILKLNRRGHGVVEIARATALLKNFGFKVTYHIMPGLPGSTAAKDLKMFKQLFSDERFQPDQIKFYPTVVTRGSLLYKWWKVGKYKPYSPAVLKKLIVQCKKIVPPYVRIIRLIRDIPGESIVAGNIITNLRQVLEQEGVKCCCIRCREIKNEKLKAKSSKLKAISYQASGGKEHFISFETKDGKYLLGFCRLRLPSHITYHISRIKNQDPYKNNTLLDCKTVLIRELHVYGELMPVGKGKRVQHTGLGKRLMAEAEKVAVNNGFEKMAVIAGVGVRDYYRRLGYRLEESYMVKKLKNFDKPEKK
jgi:elongator complex protein 3